MTFSVVKFDTTLWTKNLKEAGKKASARHQWVTAVMHQSAPMGTVACQ